MTFEVRLKKIFNKYNTYGDKHHVITTHDDKGKTRYKYVVEKNGFSQAMQDEYDFWAARLERSKDPKERFKIASYLELATQYEKAGIN